MSSVRIEDDAFSDDRYDDLAERAGLADADHARGKMARLWRQCTIEASYVLSARAVERVLGPGGVQHLVGARLGEIVANGVRIRGTAGRVEWRERLRENGKFGKLGAEFGAKGGRPRKKKNGTPTRVAKQNPLVGVSQNPPTSPATSPAPATSPVGEIREPAPRPRFDRHGQVVFDGWSYAAQSFRAIQADGIDRERPDEWSERPDLANGDQLHLRVNELISKYPNDYDRALERVRHVVDIRAVEARAQKSLRWMTPSQLWKPTQFIPALDKTAADVAARSPPAPANHQPPRPFDSED